MGKLFCLLLYLCTLFMSHCSQYNIATDPYYNTFYKSTQYIMFDNERSVYHKISDNQMRKDFIIEFWKRRDPTPETEDNEALQEFKYRLYLASQHSIKDTDRLRSIICFGKPNDIQKVELEKNQAVEIWTYYHFNITLEFIDQFGFGDYKLVNWPTNYHQALEKARKMFLSDPDQKPCLSDTKIIRKSDKIEIRLPTKQLEFEEHGENMVAEISLVMVGHLADQQPFNKSIRYILDKSKQFFLENETICLEIPLKQLNLIDILITVSYGSPPITTQKHLKL